MSTELSTLHAGSQVILDCSRYGVAAFYVRRVHRVTDTLIVLRNERENFAPLDIRYDRKTGYAKGRDSYDTERLVMPTPELLAKVEKQNLVSRLSKMNWKDIHLTTLRAVDTAIRTPLTP